MASMVRDTGTIFASRIGCIVLGLATQSILAWMLGPGLRGSYAVCIVFSGILGIVFQLGLDVAAAYFVASKRFSLSEGVTYILICGFIGGLVALAAGLVAMRMPWEFFARASDQSFQLALAHMLVSFFSVPIIGLLAAMHEFTWTAILNISMAIFNLALTGVLLLIFPKSVNAAIIAVTVTGMFGMLFVIVILSKKHTIKLVRPGIRPLLTMTSYGLRYYFGKLSNQVNFRVGTIILAFFAVESEIGLFSVASLLVTQALMIPNTFSTVLIPRVAADDEGRHELIAKCARIAGVICAVMLAILCLVATPFVAIMFSSEFLPMVPLVRIMAIGVLFRSVSKVFVPYLIGTNHPGIASFAIAAGMSVNLLLMWLLIPQIGLIGAGIAMTGNYLVSAAILTWAFLSASKTTLRSTFRFRRSDWDPLGRLWVRFFRSQPDKS